MRWPSNTPCILGSCEMSSQHQYSNKKFLILGSASRDLIHQSSESLAGRISYIELTPFSLTEISNPPLHWRRGGFPKSYLANSNKASMRWRDDYISLSPSRTGIKDVRHV